MSQAFSYSKTLVSRFLKVTDVYESQTMSCRDGSANCPAVGTFGSWGFYVLGVFMACVYLLGPKTAYGQSEQNPAYWIQLLIAAKRTGAKISWFDPVENKMLNLALSSDDIRIWARFVMSYLINGVGFHILVHALPIQGAFVRRRINESCNYLFVANPLLAFFSLVALQSLRSRRLLAL